jgi:aspartate/methionine/tyrosine aminotransferase
MKLAARAHAVAPFYVMEVVKKADQLAAEGRSIIHLSIGEPDFATPAPVQRAAADAIAAGRTGYTAALGLPALRTAIARDYGERFNVAVDPARIVVTAGASAGLALAFAALIDEGEEVLLPDPSYPCNRNFAAAFSGHARLLPCAAENAFQPTAAEVAQAWSASTRALLLASPANPTGTSVSRERLRDIAAVVTQGDGALLVDEIYHGLVYGHRAWSALEVVPDAVILNSFSKYYCMTGWRLGWLVAPEVLVPALERLAQNLYICAPTIAQHAALACFTAETRAICEERRAEFERRRARLLPGLRGLGFRIPAEPDGAFYIYADVSALAQDSWSLCFDLLEQTGVCLVPGRDFGRASPERFVRLSYATSMEAIDEALSRMQHYFDSRPGG